MKSWGSLGEHEPQGDIRCRSQFLSTLLLRRGFSMKLAFALWLGWVASKPPGQASLHLLYNTPSCHVQYVVGDGNKTDGFWPPRSLQQTDMCKEMAQSDDMGKKQADMEEGSVWREKDAWARGHHLSLDLNGRKDQPQVYRELGRLRVQSQQVQRPWGRNGLHMFQNRERA